MARSGREGFYGIETRPLENQVNVTDTGVFTVWGPRWPRNKENLRTKQPSEIKENPVTAKNDNKIQLLNLCELGSWHFQTS